MSEIHAQADDSSLLGNQVTELFRTSRLAAFTNISIATFLAAILWPVANTGLLLAWYAYTLLVTVGRAAIAAQYKQTQIPDPQRWLNLYSAGLFASGLGWGAVLLVVVPVDERFHLISAIFVIAGLATASAGSMASLKHGFAIFSIPALLPGALKLLVINENITVLIGCFICAFLVFISMVALRIHEVILHNLRKQFESAKFVVEVQEIHEALIARYDDLERQLTRSTQKVQELQTQLEQKNAETVTVVSDAERKAKGDKFNYLLDKLHGGAWNFNLKTSELRYSPQWLNMLGYREDEVYPTMDFWKSLLHPDEAGEVTEKFQLHLAGKIPQYVSSHRLRARSGEWKWVFSRAQPVAWGTFGEVLDMVCVEIDIEDPETYLARKLTTVNFKASDWLYSDTMFMQRLQYALQTTAIENIEHALCHINVCSAELPADDLQPGNELSKQLASILIRACRQEDPVLDLGNNSFAVLLENMPIDKALNKAAALQKIINSHQFSTNGQKFTVSTSIGITPIFDTHRSDAEIFEDAETACKIAFSDTPDNIFVFQRDNAEYDTDTLDQRILAKVAEILEQKRLQLMPIALKPLAAGTAVKLSWLSAALPGLKNYAAAIKDLHDPEGNNALSTAFDLCAIRMFHDWALAQPKAQIASVHVFECKPGSILDANFRTQVQQLFATSSPGGHNLCLGISEATFTARKADVLAFIEALKPAGLKFALTGFGMSPMSFDYVKSLPVDYLELHDELIASIGNDKTSLVTIKFLNELGHVLNFKTIALSAASELHEAALAKIGTDYIRNFAPESQSRTASPPAAKPFLLDVQGITH
jgi:diguanylate cyclase (GGDEF)-like protein/PAS domain S-box-containing protein